MSTAKRISGSNYLAFLASPVHWAKGIHAEGVALTVDRAQLEGDAATADAIAPDSRVTILSGDVFEGMDRLHSLQEHYDAWAHLTELKRQHDDHLDRLRKRGVTLLSYKVPCCDATLESMAAPEGGRWTSLATCPECGGMYMKITTAEKVEALVPGEEAEQ